MEVGKSIVGEIKCEKSSLNHLVAKNARNASPDADLSANPLSNTRKSGWHTTRYGKRQKKRVGDCIQKGRKDEM